MRARARLLMLCLVSCGGGSSQQPTSEQAAGDERPKGENMPAMKQICDAHCDRSVACGGEDGAACRQKCMAQRRSLGHLRGDFVWRLLSCLDQLDCTFVSEGRSFPVCFEQTTHALPLTDALRKFCFESARKAASCGRGDDADQAACRDRYRHLNDPTLEQGITCLQRSCAEVPVCFKRRFGM